MKLIKILVSVILLICLVNCQDVQEIELIEARCEEYGYPLEQHNVTTSDGYILGLFRIPFGLNQTFDPDRPVVIWHPAYLDSADSVVIRGPEWSPAFYLANEGYDVWIANPRGNKYSQGHETLDRSQEQYWNFTFTSAMNDSMAILDYVLEETDSETVGYVTHSLSSTGMLSAMALNNDYYRTKISIMFMLAPIATLQNTQSVVNQVLARIKVLLPLARQFGVYSFGGTGYTSNPTVYALCRAIPAICELAELMSTEGRPEDDDQMAMVDYLSVFPSTSSFKIEEHQSQLCQSGTFQDFDYGTVRNLEIYGSEDPATFPMQNIAGKSIS